MTGSPGPRGRRLRAVLGRRGEGGGRLVHGHEPDGKAWVDKERGPPRVARVFSQSCVANQAFCG
jgi:hypothetical protein